MRKHHNKLFYGQYTHKTTFNFPWAHKLYPTTDENLINFIKHKGQVYGKFSSSIIDVAKFILNNRDKVKFRIQGKHTSFYSDAETSKMLATKYWNELNDVFSVDPAHITKLKKNTVLCKKYPHRNFKFQIHLKKDAHKLLSGADRDAFYRFYQANRDNVKITSTHVLNYLQKHTGYCWNGYFFVKEEKYLSALIILLDKVIEKIQKYIKV